MAVTEQIKSAIYRVYNSTSSIWNRYSFWNKASSCEFDDGETAEAKLGKIKGITTSLAATETGYAADATAVKTLNDSLTAFSTTFTVANWATQSDGSYLQTQTVTGITSATQLLPPMVRHTGTQATDSALDSILGIINSGLIQSQTNTIQIKVYEKPTSDITLYWIRGCVA